MKFIASILLTTSFLYAEGLVSNPLYLLKNQIQQNNNPSFIQKKFGVEINPFYLLLLHREEQILSGSFSYFDHQNNVEYAFPIHYYKFNSDHSDDYEQYTIDLHYRKFLDDKIGGAYLSGFARLAHLEGNVYDNSDYKSAEQTKIGIGAGVGYRYFSNNNFYWGAGLSLGAYIGNHRDLEYDTPAFFIGDDHTLIVDIEFLKFGWAF